jgi:hypothetical protein
LHAKIEQLLYQSKNQVVLKQKIHRWNASIIRNSRISRSGKKHCASTVAPKATSNPGNSPSDSITILTASSFHTQNGSVVSRPELSFQLRAKTDSDMTRHKACHFTITCLMKERKGHYTPAFHDPTTQNTPSRHVYTSSCA